MTLHYSYAFMSMLVLLSEVEFHAIAKPYFMTARACFGYVAYGIIIAVAYKKFLKQAPSNNATASL